MEPILNWCDSHISIGSVSGQTYMNVYCELDRNKQHDRHMANVRVEVAHHTHTIKKFWWDDDGFIYEE